MTLSVGASAATLQIASYDIAQTPESGFGCWFNNYTGTITDTGLTVSGSVNCSPFNPARVLNYSNGSGTLNDGLFDTTQLLMTRISDQGQQLQPVITLHFGGTYTINEIRLLKGNNSFTNITGVTRFEKIVAAYPVPWDCARGERRGKSHCAIGLLEAVASAPRAAGV